MFSRIVFFLMGDLGDLGGFSETIAHSTFQPLKSHPRVTQESPMIFKMGDF
jgi:hypothetical protein